MKEWRIWLLVATLAVLIALTVYGLGLETSDSGTIDSFGKSSMWVVGAQSWDTAIVDLPNGRTCVIDNPGSQLKIGDKINLKYSWIFATCHQDQN